MFFKIKYEIDNGVRIDNHICIISADNIDHANYLFENYKDKILKNDEHIPSYKTYLLCKPNTIIYDSHSN